MKGPIATALAIVAVMCAGAIADRIERGLKTHRNERELADAEKQASVTLLGQFRTTIASWLWLRTDLYLHNGVELRQMTDAEQASGTSGVGSRDVELGKHLRDDLMVTVVPSRSADFRGLIGDLERETAPFKDMREHGHNDPKTALPLFRLMTWLDPQFIPGWVVGASVLAREGKQGKREAIAFLDRGLTENPGNLPILVERARLLIQDGRRMKEAEESLRQALRRPDPNLFALSEMESDSWLQAFRWSAMLFRDTGRAESAARVARRGLGLFRDDPVLLRLLSQDSADRNAGQTEKELAVKGSARTRRP